MGEHRLRVVQQGDLFLVQEMLRSRWPWRRPTWKTIHSTTNKNEAHTIHYCRHRQLGLPCAQVTSHTHSSQSAADHHLRISIDGCGLDHDRSAGP